MAAIPSRENITVPKTNHRRAASAQKKLFKAENTK